MQVQRFVYVKGGKTTAIKGSAANVFLSVGAEDGFFIMQVVLPDLPPSAPQIVARVFAAAAAQALAPWQVTRVVVCAAEQDICVGGLRGIPVEFTAAGPREVTSNLEPLVFWVSWLGGGERPTPEQLSFLALFDPRPEAQDK